MLVRILRTYELPRNFDARGSYALRGRQRHILVGGLT
jgi:hypothetical protein